MRIGQVSAAAVVLASALSGYADLAAPEPVSFASRGFSYVAEIFPPGSRRNAGDKPLCYLYHVGPPGTTWTVDAKLLWKAELVPLPKAGPYQAVLSTRGDLVVINGQTGGHPEHSVVIYDPAGKLVKSYPLASFTPVTSREGGLPMWGWHGGARYFFLRREARFYILLPQGKAMEFNLDDGTLQHGDTADFPKLAALAREPHADEEAKIWPTSLRFSSITDVLQAGGAVPHAAPIGAELAPEEEVTLHALLKQGELIVVGTLRRTDDSEADKMWAGHIDVAKVLVGDPSARDVHVHFQDPSARGGSARRQTGQSGIWFIFKDGKYRNVIWPHQLWPAGSERKLGPYLRNFLASEIERLSVSNAQGAAARLEHLRANLKAIAATGQTQLQPDRTLKAAVAKVRATHLESGKAMWEALAALIKPGMTVAEMTVALPDQHQRAITVTGGSFGIRYKLDDRDDGFDAVAFGAWAGAKPGDPDSKLVLSVAPHIERTSMKAFPAGAYKLGQAPAPVDSSGRSGGAEAPSTLPARPQPATRPGTGKRSLDEQLADVRRRLAAILPDTMAISRAEVTQTEAGPGLLLHASAADTTKAHPSLALLLWPGSSNDASPIPSAGAHTWVQIGQSEQFIVFYSSPSGDLRAEVQRAFCEDAPAATEDRPLDLDATATLLAQSTGGTWAKRTRNGISALVQTRPGQPDRAETCQVFPLPFDEAGRNQIQRFNEMRSAPYYLLGANDQCTVITYIAEETADVQAIRKALRLRTPAVSLGAHRLCALLLANLESFCLTLEYHDKQTGPPTHNLRLSTTAEETATPAGRWLSCRIPRTPQATAIVLHLRDSGMLNPPISLPAGDIQAPCYVLVVRAGDTAVTKNLGWGLEMLAPLEALRKVLDGEAAKAMDRLSASLEPRRKEWESQPTRNFMVHGLKVGQRGQWPVAANVHVPGSRFDEIQRKAPEIRDIAGRRLAGLQKEDIESPDRRRLVEADILRAVNAKLGPQAVRDIHLELDIK